MQRHTTVDSHRTTSAHEARFLAEVSAAGHTDLTNSFTAIIPIGIILITIGIAFIIHIASSDPLLLHFASKTFILDWGNILSLGVTPLIFGTLFVSIALKNRFGFLSNSDIKTMSLPVHRHNTYLVKPITVPNPLHFSTIYQADNTMIIVPSSWDMSQYINTSIVFEYVTIPKIGTYVISITHGPNIEKSPLNKFTQSLVPLVVIFLAAALIAGIFTSTKQGTLQSYIDSIAYAYKRPILTVDSLEELSASDVKTGDKILLSGKWLLVPYSASFDSVEMRQLLSTSFWTVKQRELFRSNQSQLFNRNNSLTQFSQAVKNMNSQIVYRRPVVVPDYSLYKSDTLFAECLDNLKLIETGNPRIYNRANLLTCEGYAHTEHQKSSTKLRENTEKYLDSLINQQYRNPRRVLINTEDLQTVNLLTQQYKYLPNMNYFLSMLLTEKPDTYNSAILYSKDINYTYPTGTMRVGNSSPETILLDYYYAHKGERPLYFFTLVMTMLFSVLVTAVFTIGGYIKYGLQSNRDL